MYKFYVKMETTEYGPYSAKEIKELDLLEDILLRQESEMEWHEAKEYNFISLANDEFGESLYELPQTSESASNKLNVTFRNEIPNVRVDPTSSYNSFIPQSDGLIACPKCGMSNNSIKCITLPYYAKFLGVYTQWQTKQYVRCPKCMKKHIIFKSLFKFSSIIILWLPI